MKKLSLLLLFFLGMNSSWAQSIAFEEPVNVYVSSNTIMNYKFDDVTGDGIKDLIVLEGDSIIIKKGNADYKTYSRFFARKAGVGTALGVEDFNNDGYKDILYVGGNNGIYLILNMQGADFEQPQYYHSGSNFAQEFAVADFNKDGYLDVALSHGHDLNGCFLFVSIYMNNQNGTLSNQVIYWYPSSIDKCAPLGGYYGYISTVDVNDDNYLDLVLTVAGSDSLLVSYNQGDTQGTFSNLIRVEFLKDVRHAHVFDLDLDGKDDIIGVAQIGRQGYYHYRNHLAKLFMKPLGNNVYTNEEFIQIPEIYNLNFRQFTNEAFANMNEDLEKDLILAIRSETKYAISNDSIAIHYNQGKGKYDLTKRDTIFAVPYRYIVKINGEDVNGDGFNDLTMFNRGDGGDLVGFLNQDTINVIYQKTKEVVITTEQERLLEQDIQLHISPNPNSGWVTCTTSMPMQQVLVYNTQGMLVWEQNVNENKVQLNTSTWAKGLYQVRVLNNQGKVCTDKMIIE